MKKKISFKLFWTVIWGGILQSVKAFLKIFGYQGSNSWDKVMWRICGTCLTLILIMLTWVIGTAFWDEIIYRKYIRPHFTENVYDTSTISSDIVFKHNYCTGKGYIYNDSTKQTLIQNVSWVCTPHNDDSLFVFAQEDKRGYANKYTGEAVIPAQYSKAWIFSEGLAAVEKDKKIIFINKVGDVVIDKNLRLNDEIRHYTFKNGYCIVSPKDNNKMGLIDLQGNWAIPPQYDNIINEYGFWRLVENEHQGLLSANLDTIYPVSYPYIDVRKNNIELHTKDTTVVQVDYDGYVLSEYVIKEICPMEYETNEIIQEYDEDGDYLNHHKIATAKCKRYYIYWNHEYMYGLIDSNGHKVTPAIYYYIEAIDEDLYLCQPLGVIINGKGERMN